MTVIARIFQSVQNDIFWASFVTVHNLACPYRLGVQEKIVRAPVASQSSLRFVLMLGTFRV